jgi:ATP-dependent phosphofructokinase / diphosphate-dependent phosphofructokinase
MARRLGILNSGGDCAGLNTVIASVVTTGTALGYEFIGFEKGWEGILDPVMYRSLTVESVRGIAHLGGTILRTANKGRFAGKIGHNNVSRIPDEILDMACRNLAELEIEGLIVIGGDGTLSAAMQLAERGINIIGVPKTIDNDLPSTDRTFGFSTAVQVAVDAIDRIQTTAESHERVIFVECMGRFAGWIALHAGLAGNADCILIPEIPCTTDQLITFLRKRRDQGFRSSVVVVAEGVQIAGEHSGRDTGAPELTLGGISEQLMRQVNTLAPGEFETRHVVLGHTQRGGSPNAEDRILAKKYGTAAMQAYHQGHFGNMVSLRGNEIALAPISDAGGDLKGVTRDCPEYQTAQALGIVIE